MNNARSNLAIGLSLLAVGLSVAAILIATKPWEPERDRFGFTAEERAVAQAKADHLRSGSQIRGLAMGVVFWASEHDNEAPPADSWAQALVDSDLIPPEVLEAKGAEKVETPYHYIRPTREQIADTRNPEAGQIVVFYEDPGLWGGAGGNLAMLDTSVEWIEGEAYAERVRELRASP